MSVQPTYGDGSPVERDVNGDVIPLPAPDPILGDAPRLDSFGDPAPVEDPEPAAQDPAQGLSAEPEDLA